MWSGDSDRNRTDGAFVEIVQRKAIPNGLTINVRVSGGEGLFGAAFVALLGLDSGVPWVVFVGVQVVENHVDPPVGSSFGLETASSKIDDKKPARLVSSRLPRYSVELGRGSAQHVG